MVTAILSLALICFQGAQGDECHPALFGKNTPAGLFQLEWVSTDEPGYGGDVLMYKEGDTYALSIHRLYSVPGQARQKRLESPWPNVRRWVTNGCINVSPDVYQRLLDCCRKDRLLITE